MVAHSFGSGDSRHAHDPIYDETGFYGAHDGVEPQVAAAPGVAKFTHWAGALTSLALILGLVFWGYKLIVRDASGVPIVAAMEGPMRIEPLDPGGQPAAHQGLAVNEIAADGTASNPSLVALAPSAAELSQDDALPLPEVEELEQTAALAPETEAALQELVDELARQSAGRISSGPRRIDIVPGGLGTSLRPQIRPTPASLGPVPVTSTALAAPRAEAPLPAVVGPLGDTRDVPADQVPAGTRLVQLGAYESPEIAKDEWDKVSARFDGYLATKARVIEKAVSGGKTFYRLRAMGFEDLSDARRFCAALVSEKAACIPVVTR